MSTVINTETPGIIVVGAGQAGGEVVTALRQQGYTGALTLIGDEVYLPYRRPPLSKAFLSGEATLESLYLKSQAAYDKLDVQVRLGMGVEALDRQARRVCLRDGTLLPYDKLVLATGGRARRLSLPGGDLPNVHYVRTIDDILKMQAQFKTDARLVIVGGGYIGLEAASVGIKKGLKVTVVEAAERVLARVAAPELSAFYAQVHRQKGVDLITSVGVREFAFSDCVDTVMLADGRRLPADMVIAGIGLLPNTELADRAGLVVSEGIEVNAYCLTSDPNVYAIGDCTSHENGFLGRRMRLESVPNAVEQARVVASHIVGKPTPYHVAPWFWSDQYDLKLQMVGLSKGYEQIVIRGDMSTHSFSAFYLKDGIVICADAVNRPQDFLVAKKLVADRLHVAPRQLSDESIPLKSLIPTAS